MKQALTQKKEVETFYPTSQQHWRKWLKKYHRSRECVWLIMYKKASGKPTIGWSEAVDEALCFGWVDSKRVSIDKEKFRQFFCKRKARSTWSKINKEKVRQLIDQGLMTIAGLEIIEIAKQNGSWTIFEETDALKIPKDLAKELRSRPGARKFFLGLSKSAQKNILQWLVLARRPETRQKRIVEIADLAAQGLRPKQFR